MNRLFLLIIFLFSFQLSHSQAGYLYIKKGFHKKRTYNEGDDLVLKLNNDLQIKGTITLLRNDTVFLNARPVPLANIKAVIVNEKTKKSFRTNAAEILLITGGVGLTAAGLTLSKQASFGQALTAGLVIGYGPLLVRYLASKISLKRKKFIIGKKFRLQILDFYLSPQPGQS